MMVDLKGPTQGGMYVTASIVLLSELQPTNNEPALSLSFSFECSLVHTSASQFLHECPRSDW